MTNLMSVAAYGIIIGSAMVLCILLACVMLKKRGYNYDIVFDIAIICIPLAIVGARLYYVVFDIIGGGHPASYWGFWRIIGFSENSPSSAYNGLSGLAIYGGIIGAVIGAIFVRLINKRKKSPLDRMTYIQMLDAFFVFIMLGQAIGRWGNFANGEAHGAEITNPALQWFPLAVEIGGRYYQATFFYESLWNIIGFGLLMYLCYGKKKSFDGFVFAGYCIWYGLGRMVIEGMRTDSLMCGGLRVSQMLSGLIFALGVCIILYHIWQAKKNDKKIFIHVAPELLSEEYCGYEKTIMYLHSVYDINNVGDDNTGDAFDEETPQEIPSDTEQPDETEQIPPDTAKNDENGAE